MPPTLPMNTPRGRDEQWLSVTKPTATTRFFRTFLPWQLVRFIIINVKMMRIISVSHHPKHGARRTPGPSARGARVPEG